jgi:hypothetical protein
MRENSAAVQQSQGEARKQFFFEKKNQKTSIHWSQLNHHSLPLPMR